MESIHTNPKLELAYNFIQHTKQNIFLTGKAGTGKTTFLRKIKSESIKRTAVVAPTGIAAINAKGVTIHSLFQLPFGPNVPGVKRAISRKYQFSKRKINLLRSLDLLIIDEISMVRADVLDSIDEVLRRYKDFHKPFGGVQLLMIGDLHQLPPVVKSSEWELLKEHYTTAYFFGSNALKRTNPITIQLTHIYRQSDDVFIKLLNKVRDNKLDTEVLNLLNSRYIPDFQPTEEEGYITLTSHNRTAQAINEERLKSLSTPSYKFKAVIKGEFPEHAYPTEAVLEFKVGAQVLFIRNDTSEERAYYNGKIGQITQITDESIYVKCPGDNRAIEVQAVDWKNIKYSLDENKEILEDEKGVFIQYPLKLAWAITIHKSQGLTFEKAIIDAQAAFAHGQVYVALSRCKSFEGIVLRSTIGYASVKTDVVVKDYSAEAAQNAPDEAQLAQSKMEYQQELVEELFGFREINQAIRRVARIYSEFDKNLTTAVLEQFKLWETAINREIISVMNKFQPEIQEFLLTDILPEENEQLKERMQKAGAYFAQKLKVESIPQLLQLPTASDNQEVQKKAMNSVRNLAKALSVKCACFDALKMNFSTQLYLKTRADAAIDFDNKKTNHSRAKQSIPANIPYPDLYQQLLNWREAEAKQHQLTLYDVLSTASLKELVTFLPVDLDFLRKIKGVGAVKIDRYGVTIVNMIKEYCVAKGLKGNLNALNPSILKKDTKRISYDLYKAGKSIQEIAAERNFTTSTIKGHLGYYVLHEELSIYEFLKKEIVEEIEQFFNTKEVPLLSEAKTYFGEKYTYGDLRMVVDYMNSKPTIKKEVSLTKRPVLKPIPILGDKPNLVSG